MLLATYPMDSTPICGMLEFGASTIPSDDFKLTILISGLVSTDNILVDSIEISRSLDEKASLSFSILDRTASRHYDVGEHVLAIWDGTKLFAGQISRVNEVLIKDGDTPLVSEIECTDWSRLFDRFYVKANYTGSLLRTILEDLLKNKTPLWNQEGVTVGSTPTLAIDKIDFEYERMSECMRRLCDLGKYTWSVDADKKVQIYEQTGYSAPFTVGDGSTSYRGLSYLEDLSQYRNVQWLRVPKGVTDTRTEHHRGDPTTVSPTKRKRSFTLSYPVSSIVSITRGTVAQRVGVKDVDTDGDAELEGWKQWFYSVDESTITQNSDEDEVNNPTLTSDEILTIVYKGFYSFIVYLEDTVEINNRQAVEGGSGRYEVLEEDDDLDTVELAEAKVVKLLQQYGQVIGNLKYEVDTFGLLPGQLQTITISDHGITAREFMIASVLITFPGFKFLRSEIKAIDSKYIEGYPEFWRKKLAMPKSFVVLQES